MERLTVGALVTEPELALEVIVEPDPSRPVRGVRLADVTRPREVVSAGMVAFTTGVLISQGGAGSAASFVHDIADAGAAALVFAREAVLAAPPPELVSACREQGLGLLALPGQVTFAQLAEIVSAALAGGDAYRLRRQLWFQTDLLAVLAEEQPLQALMARMDEFVRGTAVLYEASGRMSASVGDGPVRLLWSELAARPREGCALSVGRYHVLAEPVVMRGSGYWLAVATRHAATLADIGEPLLETAAQMLSAMRGARALSRTQDQARAQHLLTVLPSEVRPERVPSLWARLREHGFTPRTPVRAVVAHSLGAHTVRRRVDRLEELYERAHLSTLPVVLGDDPADATSVLALVADDTGLGGWLTHLSRDHAVGVSERALDIPGLPAAFRDARMAAQIGRLRVDRAGSDEGLIVRFEDVDLATWLVSARTPEAVADRAARRFGAVLERTDLVETLIAYLRHEQDVAATASAVFLHPNTVRYRLRRVEELIGSGLRDPATLTDLYLALHSRLAAR